MAEMSSYDVQGVCDQRKGAHPDPLMRICDKPAMFRYRTAGGYMLLCAEHGEKQRSICETWNGTTWRREFIDATPTKEPK